LERLLRVLLKPKVEAILLLLLLLFLLVLFLLLLLLAPLLLTAATILILPVAGKIPQPQYQMTATVAESSTPTVTAAVREVVTASPSSPKSPQTMKRTTTGARKTKWR
jgi:hypothetical protein